MNISFGSLLPALTKLGGYFKEGMDHYVAMKASGAEVTPDLLSMFIHAKMDGWDPKVKGKKIEVRSEINDIFDALREDAKPK